MKNAIKKLLGLGFGVGSLTQKQANKVVKEMMKRYGVDENEGKRLAREIMNKSMEAQKRVGKIVEESANRAFRVAGLATQKDLDALKKRMTKKKTKKKASKRRK